MQYGALCPKIAFKMCEFLDEILTVDRLQFDFICAFIEHKYWSFLCTQSLSVTDKISSDSVAAQRNHLQ